MKLHLITFADKNMSRAANLCISSAYQHGVTSHYLYTPEILQSREIVKVNPEVFRQPEDPRRAWAWWAFKPVILAEAMGGMADGEFALYSDAGVAFINSLRYVTDRMKPGEDVWLYGNEWPHYMWCKRGIIDAIWPTTTKDLRGLSQDGSFQSAWRRYGNQVQASIIFFRVNDHTRAFVAEWLKWCVTKVPDPRGVEPDRYLIDDSPSFAPNHPAFRENRHDQAILTTMADRDGIKLHGWFVKYLTYEPARVGYSEDSDIPTLYLHHRLRNDYWREYEARTIR